MLNTEISRGLLSDQVYDLVRASILDGTNAPGTRLVESEIARRLEVSQAPVREAIKKLVHQGLVTSVPRQGSYVTSISPEEFVIVREMRASLEQLGARLAVTAVQPADLLALRAIVERMKGAIAASDWALFRNLDIEFHRTALMISNHGILARLWATLESMLLSSRALGDPLFPGDQQKLISWHEDLIEAIAGGDPEHAAALFFAHAMGTLPLK
jgi:DNA-binding GntR family transcriptional regulator